MKVEHAWSALFEKAFREETSGQYAGVFIEGITLAGAFPDPLPPNAAAHASFSLVSAWYLPSKSDPIDPVAFHCRVGITLSDGRELDKQEFEGRAIPDQLTKTKVQFPVLPLAESGAMYFTVELKHEETWTAVARLPLFVKLLRRPPD